MKNRIRILSVIIALLTLFTVFSLSVYATDVETPAPVDPPVDTEPVDPVDPPVDTDPVDPVDPPVDTDPVTPTTPVDPGNEGDTTDPTVPDSGDQSDGYVDNNDDYFYFDEDEMAASIENAAGSVSEATNQYDTSDINVSALKETKWNDITLDTSAPQGDAMDFSAIKENTRNNDDGQWIFYTGIVLIGLAVVGILYFIIATTTYKNKLKKLNERQLQHDARRARDDYGDDAYAPATHDYSRRNKKRYAADGMGYAERKRLKADTAEINLPDKYRARH